MYAQPPGQIRDTFWKTFGRYMSPVPSASGQRINWVNYKTGMKSVRFKLELTDNRAAITLEVRDSHIFAGSFLPLRPLFESMAGKDWTWEASGIASSLTGRDVRKREDWPELISFFKQRLIALDAFWQEVKDAVQ